MRGLTPGHIVGFMVAGLVTLGLALALSRPPAAQQPQPQLIRLSNAPHSPQGRSITLAATGGTSGCVGSSRPVVRRVAPAGSGACPAGSSMYLELRAMHSSSSEIDQVLMSSLPGPAGISDYTVLRRLGAPSGLARQLVATWDREHDAEAQEDADS